MKNSRVILDPLDSNQMVYLPPGGPRVSEWKKQRVNKRSNLSRLTSVEYENSAFSEVQQLASLNAIGQTRPKGTLYSYRKGHCRPCSYDAGFVVAPQDYKDGTTTPTTHISLEKIYSKFPIPPTQQQVLYCGQLMIPIPSAPRSFYKDELEDTGIIKESVFIRGFHCSPDEQAEIRNLQYKTKETKSPTHDTWIKKMLRGLSSLPEPVDLPPGELFSRENKLD